MVLEQHPIHSSSPNACFTKGLPGKTAIALVLAPLLHYAQPEETKRSNDFATDESRREGDEMKVARVLQFGPPNVIMTDGLPHELLGVRR